MSPQRRHYWDWRLDRWNLLIALLLALVLLLVAARTCQSPQTVAPVISSPAADAVLIAGALGDISGRAGPNTTVRVVEGADILAETTANANGDWRAALPELGVGDHAIIVQTFGRDGNPLTNSDPIRFTVVPVPAPSQPPTFNIRTARISPDAEFEIAGMADPQSPISIFDGETLLGKTAADEGGNWRFVLPPLTAGTHAIIAKILDANDTILVESAPLALEVTAEQPPAISEAESTATTTAAQPDALTGVTQPGATVRLTEDGKVLAETTADASGAWTLPTSDLPPGEHSVVVEIVDASGAIVQVSEPQDLVIAAAPTTEPQVFAPLIIGPEPGAPITVTEAPTLTGEAPPGAVVRLFDGETLLGETIADADGVWTYTAPDLSPGEHAIVAKTYDANGSEIAVSAPQIIVIGAPEIVEAPEQTGPTAELFPAPAIASPAEGAILPADAPGNLSGTADPGARVRILNRDALLGETSANETGAWNYTLPELPAGALRLLVQTVSAAGEVMASSEPLPLALVTGVVTPTITETVNAGALPILSGSAPPGSAVEILQGDVSIGVASTDDDGTWVFQPADPLPPGKRDLTPTLFNAAGETISSGEAVEYRAPAPPRQSVQTLRLLTPLPLPESNSLPTLRGNAAPGSNVHIFDSETKLGEVKTDENGRWHFVPPAPLTPGAHILRTVMQRQGGKETAGPIVLATIAEDAAPISPPTIDAPPQNRLTPQRPLQGTAPAGSQVQVLEGGKLLGAVYTNADNRWDFPLPPLRRGKHALRAAIVAPDGAVLSESPVLVLRVSGAAPRVLPVTGGR